MHRGPMFFVLGFAAACSRNSETPSRGAGPGDSGTISRDSMVAPASTAAGVQKREVPFDGGVAHVETAVDGREHVILIQADGGVLGESWCANGASGYDAVRAFFTRVRAAVLADEREQLADSMEFPLRVNDVSTRLGGAPRARFVSTREQFLREYSTILTDEVLARVREADPGQVSCSWRGHDLGDGVFYADLGESDTLAINAVNVGPPVRTRVTQQ